MEDKNYTRLEVADILRNEIAELEQKVEKLEKKLQKEVSNVKTVVPRKVNDLMNEITMTKYAINTLYVIIGKNF